MDMDRISGETNHVSENSAKGYSGRELKALLGCTLFSGIDAGELTGLLGCLDARKRTFLKNEFIYHSGEPVSSMGIVLSGSVHIVKEDFWGRRHLLSEAGEGNFFAEAYASLPGTPLSVSVLPLPPDADPECALRSCREKSDAHEKDGAAVPPLHPRKAPGLPVGCFRPGRLQLLFHPIQQTATCRLPLHRPERALFGAWPAEAGRRA